jgi:uncharacterized protein
MISLQQLLGKDDRFFRLLDASAELASESVRSLQGLLRDGDGGLLSLEGFAEARRKDQQITQEISEHLAKVFVTALEREDIETLSHVLYKIPKTIEKFAVRYILSVQHVRGVDFSRQLALLEMATARVVVMVKRLRHSGHLDEIREDNAILQQLEGEADKLVLELLRDLYSGRHEPHKVIALKDLYELLEKVIDRCRDAGNMVVQIFLKHA